MAEVSKAERLDARHQFVVVLRLVVETGGRVVYGEVLDPRFEEGRHRFVGLSGLKGAVRDWLQEAMRGPSRDNGSSLALNGTEHGPVR